MYPYNLHNIRADAIKKHCKHPKRLALAVIGFFVLLGLAVTVVILL